MSDTITPIWLDAENESVEWWRRLEDGDRWVVAHLFHHHWDACAFGRQDGDWRELPIVVDSALLDHLIEADASADDEDRSEAEIAFEAAFEAAFE